MQTHMSSSPFAWAANAANTPAGVMPVVTQLPGSWAALPTGPAAHLAKAGGGLNASYCAEPYTREDLQLLNSLLSGSSGFGGSALCDLQACATGLGGDAQAGQGFGRAQSAGGEAMGRRRTRGSGMSVALNKAIMGTSSVGECRNIIHM